jgi:uncharacterized protein DUF1801
MQSFAKTPNEYIENLPDDRQAPIATLRALIKKALPKGYEEGMDYGMITYHIPLSRYPDTYNDHPLQYVALASQKNYMSLYLMGVYGEHESSFRKKYEATGKKLNMGKSCLRFTSIDDLALDVIADTIAATTLEEYIAIYEKSRGIR